MLGCACFTTRCMTARYHPTSAARLMARLETLCTPNRRREEQKEQYKRDFGMRTKADYRPPRPRSKSARAVESCRTKSLCAISIFSTAFPDQTLRKDAQGNMSLSYQKKAMCAQRDISSIDIGVLKLWAVAPAGHLSRGLEQLCILIQGVQASLHLHAQAQDSSATAEKTRSCWEMIEPIYMSVRQHQ